MPELPEVEVVRRGLESHVVGRTIDAATFSGHRVARRHVPGPEDLADRLAGRTVNAARLAVAAPWIVLVLLASSPEAVMAYNTPVGAAVLLGGLAVSLVSYAIMLRIGALPEEQRVLR